MKARHKWLFLVGDIVVWELTCDPGELLSEEADRWIAKHPVLARVAIVTVGILLSLHLANLVDPNVDPISPSFVVWQRVTRAGAFRPFSAFSK